MKLIAPTREHFREMMSWFSNKARFDLPIDRRSAKLEYQSKEPHQYEP